MPSADEHAPAVANGGGQPPKPIKIAFVLYRVTALDIIRPFEVLAFVPGHDAVFVAAEPGPGTDDTGRCQLVAAASLEKITAPDVVVSAAPFPPRSPTRRWCSGCAGFTPPPPGPPASALGPSTGPEWFWWCAAT